MYTIYSKEILLTKFCKRSFFIKAVLVKKIKTAYLRTASEEAGIIN